MNWVIRIESGFDRYTALPSTKWMKVYESYDAAHHAFAGMVTPNMEIHMSGDNVTAAYNVMGMKYYIRLERL